MAETATSRKRVRFNEEDLEAAKRLKIEGKDGEGSEEVVKDKKHTLDSDEEDEGSQDKEYDVNELEGQEEATIVRDGDIEIMPFNMNEDMKEGYFNEEGEFIYKKNKDEEDAHDAWLDSVNWESVKNKNGEDNEDEKEEENVNIDGVDVCEKILEYFKDDKKTLDQVLKKMNSEKNLSAAEERKLRWAAKKSGVPFTNPSSEEVKTLTTLIEALITLGHQDVYSFTKSDVNELYEKLEIEKELADRKARMEKAATESTKQEVSADLIAALGSDDEEEMEEDVREESEE